VGGRDWASLFPDWVKEHGPVPEVLPELEVIEATESTIGRDERGSLLWSELEAFFRRYRIDDEDEREVWEVMFWTIAAERGSQQAKRMESKPEDR